MADKIRVVKVVPDLRIGGAERTAVNILTALDRSKFAPTMVSLGRPVEHSPFSEMLAAHEVPLIHLNGFPRFDLRLPGRFRQVVRQIRPHVVHTHVRVLKYTLWPALTEGVPLQLHTVQSLASREVGPVGLAVRRPAFSRWGVYPVAISEAVGESLSDYYDLDEYGVILSRIPVDRFYTPQVPRETWRQREGFAPGDLLIVTVARLSHEKRQPQIIEAFANGPAAHHPDAHLLLVGDGPMRPLLEAQALSLGLTERVHFLGWRSDIPDVLHACDLFVLASHWEGLGMAVMEAMAAGRAVVSTRVGGVPEMVIDGETGLLVPPGDVGALSAALTMLADERERLAQMGRAGAVHAREHFRVRAMAAAYEELYVRLLERRGALVPATAQG